MNSPWKSTGWPSSRVRSTCIHSRVRRYRGADSSDSPGMSLEMMFTVSRPPSIRSMVAIWRANWGSHNSPIRTASSSRIRSVRGAIPAAKAVASIPRV